MVWTAEILNVTVPGQLLGPQDDEYHTNWRNNIAAVLTHDRVIDGNLKSVKFKTKH